LESQTKFGLLGKNISYSFSKKYFTDKFSKPLFESYTYENFDIQSIDELTQILIQNKNLKGLNVTIPYKESVQPFLNKTSKKAIQIGAVNVIKISKKGILKGYNSDWYGFKKSIEPLLLTHHKKALILGTGGAAKAVAFALNQLNILYTFVSRTPSQNTIDYSKINETTFDNFQIIINCTPLGTHPNSEEYPNIPFEFISKKHLVFDLIYNPEKTQFLKRAEKQGATIKNGHEMLIFQAEKAWQIWNK
jgi:shikimate dehydrogenase